MSRSKDRFEQRGVDAAPRPARRAVVVGAGLGGLSAAIRLAASGWRVTVYEQQSLPGGKAGSESRGDYRFDTGPSLLTMPRCSNSSSPPPAAHGPTTSKSSGWR